jgi:biotin synthase
MTLDWDSILARGQRGEGISEDEALAVTALTDPAQLERLFATADALRRHFKGNAINTCGITNAKSGRCAEKCNFCSQSAFFKTEAPKYAQKSADTIVAEAEAAFAGGVREFSVVMAGRAIDKEPELQTLEDAFRRIRSQTGLQTCASLGLMSKENLARLKAAGLQSVHHNLETARSFHASIVETHTYDEERATIEAARELGMYTCSGGIFGMGESWAQRVELALDLRALGVDSVPINFLNARPGTPLEGLQALTPLDCLKIIALVRLVLPQQDIIVCGGRAQNLQDDQSRLFAAGANGLMLGNYLTTAGASLEADLALLEAQGLVIRPPPHQPHPSSVPAAVRGAGTDLAGLADKPVSAPVSG